MRRLLIRLVALETVLLGCLAYWLFLLYANNPLVSQGLAAQLSRFPQLAFTTVDISVLIIIVSLSLLMAFKFQRGLRPGIRLERALQMLESLMKRNLVLEAQVAEQKLEKTQVGSTGPPTPSPEPRMGSWERVFKTPIEAGPTVPTPQPRPSSFVSSSIPQTSIGPVRGTSAKSESPPEHFPATAPPSKERGDQADSLAAEKESRKSSQSSPLLTGSIPQSFWEDSPSHANEPDALKPSASRTPATPLPISTSKQPYIPVPVPKGSVPPGVIVGPGITINRLPATQPKPGTKIPMTDQVNPKTPQKPAQPAFGRPSGSLMPVGVASTRLPTPSPPPSMLLKTEVRPERDLTREGSDAQTKPETVIVTKTATKAGAKSETKPDVKNDPKTDSKPFSKAGSKPLRKFPYEEED